MNNKYLKRFILVIAIGLTYIMGINTVYADPESSLNIQGGGTGSTSNCGDADSNCFSLGTGGIRMALYKHDEDSLGNATNTKVGKTIDIWYYDNSVYFFGANATNKICYKGKQFRNNINDDNLSICSINLGSSNGDDNDNDSDYKAYSSGQILPGILTGMNANYSGGKYIDAEETKKLNTRVPNVTETIMNRIEYNLTQPFNGQPKHTYINNILSKMGAGITASNMGGKYYLVVEPLVQWENSGVYGGSYNFFGTPSELTRIFTNVYNKNKGIGGQSIGYHYVYYKLGLTNNISGANEAFNTAYEESCGGVNSCAYYKLASMGVGASTTGFIPSGSGWVGLKSYSGTPGFKTLKDKSASLTYGVGFISLYVLDDGADCNKQARSIISKEDYTNDNYIEKLKGTDTKPNKKIIEACFKEDGSFNKEKCYQLLPDYVSKVGIVAEKRDDNTDIDVCKPLDCREILAYTPNVLASKFNPNDISHISEGDSYFTSEHVSVYDLAIKYLFDNADTFFREDEQTEMLAYKNYKQLNIPASCTGISDCKPVDVIASCNVNGKNKFTLSDSKDITNCISKGYAYNNLKADKKFQTSYDAKFDINGEKGYCYESVSFELPTKPTKTKAGRLLVWGMSDVQLEGIFGYMTVERTCYYGGAGLTDKNKTLNTEWIGSINPDIQVSYREGLPSEIELNEENQNMYSAGTPKKLKISDPKSINITEINDVDMTGKITVSNYNNGYNWKELSTSTIKHFTTSVTYDIEYDTNLKWYADKSRNGKYVDATKTEKDDTNIPLAKYLPIGYGLPTSFITPTHKDYGKTAFENITKANGYLYVAITNIGSQIAGNGFHFDTFILQKNLKDDTIKVEDLNENKGEKVARPTELIYSCPFDIENQLYGYEDGLKDSTKKPMGLDVVFRTIELTDSSDYKNIAFPGRDGNGRTDNIGNNWKIIDEELLKKLISTKIYDEKPLYHIELTPSKIKEIRLDNKDTEEPYINMTEDLYIFSKNTLVELTKEQYEEKFKELDCDDSEDKEACLRTNLLYAQMIENQEKYEQAKKDKYYEPYKYAASKFLSKLHDSKGLTGICIDTYGS